MDTVVNLAEAVRTGERKATEVLDQHAAAIGAADDKLNAFVHLDLDRARDVAEEVDARRARGEDPGPLAGVPFGVKDLEDCAGMPTSYGSLLFKGRPPVAQDSIHVGRLRTAGAVPVGKTATPEFGTVCFTSTRAWGTTANPWNLDRTPGGSSGGSAAAVAAGLVPFCTASDGGGSTRIPASFTGLVGFKASYGRIPHSHAAPSQTTCVGALTTTVADAARHLDVAAGPDDRDRASLPPPGVAFERAIEQLDVAGLRAAWSPDLGFAVVEPEVTELTESAALALAEAAGLELVDRPIRLTDPVRTWLSSGAGDLWMDIEQGMYPERADDMDPLSRAIFDATVDLGMPRYAQILQRRAQLEEEIAAIFDDVDVLLTPATAVPAFAATGPMPSQVAGEKVHPAMVVPFTMVGNLCWNPAVSVPAGPTEAGLPIGMQVMGRRHADATVLRLARIYEQVRPWPRVAPRPFARSA
jgi:aspartyl-tRNA(Asn)/glutamyl-tRNA(Gln) amidotransferase subunit A